MHIQLISFRQNTALKCNKLNL